MNSFAIKPYHEPARRVYRAQDGHPAESKRTVTVSYRSSIARQVTSTVIVSYSSFDARTAHHSLFKLKGRARGVLSGGFQRVVTRVPNRLDQEQEVSRAFRDIVEANGVLNDCVCNQLINTHDLSFGKIVLKKMKEQGVLPTTVTFNTLIKLCAQKGDLTSAFDFLGQMGEPNAITHNLILDCFVCCKQFDHAKQWFVENLVIKILDEALDCHGLSPGAAFIQLLVYLDEHPETRRFCVITGKGIARGKHEPYFMKQSLTKLLIEHLPTWDVQEPMDSGMITLRKTS